MPLNSADKLQGVHGSPRSLLNDQNQIWQNTDAYNSPSVPLDKGFGAGHLNVQSAVTNFAPGEHGPGIVPRIGWDFSPLSEAAIDYVLDEPVLEETWIAVTLAWDRLVQTNEVDNSYNATSLFVNNPIEDELVNLDLFLLDGSDNVVQSSEATADSVEHIFWQVPEGQGGDFKIRVTNAGGGNEWPEGYGLAWWAGEAPTPLIGDFDENGAVNGDDLEEWRMDFALNGNSDADGDGDSDGNDFILWQRNLGATSAVLATTPVPEPAVGLLCCLALPLLRMGRRRMTHPAAALLIGVGVTAIATHSANAANLELVRNSRSVTSAEVAGGAPSGGIVHDFYVTSDADLLTIAPDLNVSVFKHPYNSNHESPDPELVAMFPAVGASSFLRMPSSTIVLGGGFTVPGSAWGDLSNDGPQSNFHFGRLTTSQAGTFAGSIAVRGAEYPISFPFSLSLPSSGEGLLAPTSERQSLYAEEPRVTPPTPVVPTGPDLNQRTPPDFSGNVSIELTRRSRAVSEREQKFGAPAAYVHDFFVSTSTDLISIGNVKIEGAAYQHPHGSDRKPPNERVLRLWPASSADSFVTTPGTTRGMGKGFYGNEDAEIAWYDESDDGPLEEFLFARLTVEEAGSFAGNVSVRGPNGRVSLPFKFALPESESDSALLDGEQTYRLELSFDELASGLSAQVPEPATWILFCAVLPFALGQRHIKRIEKPRAERPRRGAIAFSRRSTSRPASTIA